MVIFKFNIKGENEPCRLHILGLTQERVSTEMEPQDPKTTADISVDTKQAYRNNQNSAYKACSSQTSSLVLL